MESPTCGKTALSYHTSRVLSTILCFGGKSILKNYFERAETRNFFLIFSRPLSNSRPPGNFQKSNPDPRGNLFERIPGACPGGCAQLELTETLRNRKVRRNAHAPRSSHVLAVTALTSNFFFVFSQNVKICKEAILK